MRRSSNNRAKIGVAFGGGGVRGLAHLGVLQALEEAQIPVDAIAGASAGGLVAGLYATGMPLSEIIAFGKNLDIMDFASLDPAWRGLFNHDKMTALLARLLGSAEVTFEDLKIPAAVTAVDVEKGELVVLDRGPLIPALAATSSFPIVFSPIHHQGRWLIDGGALNNLPVDIVRRMGADRVLGVTVPPSVQISLEERPSKRGLSLRNLFSSRNGTRDWKQPLLIAEASSVTTTSLLTHTRLRLYPVDILIEVALPHVGLFLTNQNAEIIDAGYQAAKGRLSELVALKDTPLPPNWLRRLKRLAWRLRLAWRVCREPDHLLYD
jgi:predicted acylesterase/phospholipase RssA